MPETFDEATGAEEAQTAEEIAAAVAGESEE
jgi:cell division initiation protein